MQCVVELTYFLAFSYVIMAAELRGGEQGPIEEILLHSAPPSRCLVTCIVANGGITPPMYSSRTSVIWVTNTPSPEHLIF